MGVCLSCCIPKGLDMPVEQFYGKDLPDDIIRVNEDSEKEIIEEFIDVIANSFCGSTTTAPEPVLSYIMEETVSMVQYDLNKTQHVEPLQNPPSEERIASFKYLCSFAFYQFARHGGCYALLDKNGKIVCAAITIPPNDKQLHATNLAEMINVGLRLGDPPRPINTNNIGKKLEEVEKVFRACHEEVASGRHLYIHMIAVKVDAQSKGYGTKLVNFFADAADFQQVPTYLETAGNKMEVFYDKRGFELAKRHKFEVHALSPKDNSFVECFQPDGYEGFSAMVRKHTKQS